MNGGNNFRLTSPLNSHNDNKRIDRGEWAGQRVEIHPLLLASYTCDDYRPSTRASLDFKCVQNLQVCTDVWWRGHETALRSSPPGPKPALGITKHQSETPGNTSTLNVNSALLKKTCMKMSTNINQIPIKTQKMQFPPFIWANIRNLTCYGVPLSESKAAQMGLLERLNSGSNKGCLGTIFNLLLILKCLTF